MHTPRSMAFIRLISNVLEATTYIIAMQIDAKIIPCDCDMLRTAGSSIGYDLTKDRTAHRLIIDNLYQISCKKRLLLNNKFRLGRNESHSGLAGNPMRENRTGAAILTCGVLIR